MVLPKVPSINFLKIHLIHVIHVITLVSSQKSLNPNILAPSVTWKQAIQ